MNNVELDVKYVLKREKAMFVTIFLSKKKRI